MRRKTHEEFIEEMNNISPNIQIIGKYQHNKIHVECKCKVCNYEWSAIPNNLLRGSGCPNCKAEKTSKLFSKTHEQFIEEMKVINPNIEVLGKYTKSNEKITCKCKLCNNIWEAIPNDLLQGHGCPPCNSKKASEKQRKSHEDFLIEMSVVHPELEVLSKYITSKKKVTCKCKECGNIFDMKPNSLLVGQGCPPCNKRKAHEKRTLSNEEFLERIDKLNPNYEVLDTYTNCETKIRCRCNVCNGIWEVKPIKLLNGRGCPICNGNKCVSGINDIATVRPDLIKYFANKEESTKYTFGSCQRLVFKCPDCGHEKEMKINDLAQYGFSCDICSDNFSYPNKYMRGFISQLSVENIIYEYSPEWIKPYKYDGYFEYNGQSYIMEMDGMLGHGNLKYGSKEKDTKGLERDKYKDKMAKQHNIKVIRIDCIKSESDYISNNIMNSRLAYIFDLSSIDWNKCNEIATKNIVKDVCEYFNKTNLSVLEIAKNLKFGRNTIRRYLKRGTELGWCNYVPNPHKSRKQPKTEKKNKKIEVLSNGIVLHEFYGSTECAENMSTIYNDTFAPSSIRNVCNGYKQTYKGFIFKYAS